MRIFIFLFLAYGLIIEDAFSQHRLKGFLGIEGGESFNYVMEFKDSSGFIKGYSYTYQTEKKEVKARIEGILDRENKTLRFRETELLYNHGFESNAIICLIRSELKFVKEDEEKVFKGAITTSDITNVSCSGGTIVINDENAVNNIFESTASENTTEPRFPEIAKPVKPVKYRYDTATTSPKNSPASEKTQKVTEGKDAVIYWTSDSVVLYIWDGGKIDGDALSVWAGDKNLLNKYLLTKDKKRIVIPLMANEMTITVKADNEGNEPPNTANMILEDGLLQYPIFIYNTFDKTAKIKIIGK